MPSANGDCGEIANKREKVQGNHPAVIAAAALMVPIAQKLAEDILARNQLYEARGRAEGSLDLRRDGRPVQEAPRGDGGGSDGGDGGSRGGSDPFVMTRPNMQRQWRRRCQRRWGRRSQRRIGREVRPPRRRITLRRLSEEGGGEGASHGNCFDDEFEGMRANAAEVPSVKGPPISDSLAEFEDSIGDLNR